MTREAASAPSIGRQVDLANLLTAVSALVVAGLLMLGYQYFSLRSGLVSDMHVQARIVSDSSTAAIVFNDRRASEETLGALAASPNVEAAAIYSYAGDQVAAYERQGEQPVARPADVLLADGHAFRPGTLEVLEAVRLEDAASAIGYVVLRVSLASMYRQLAGYAALMMVVAVASLAAAYFLVARMRRAVRSAEAHLDYLAHVDPVTGLPNRHTFNHRLDFAVDRVRQFGGAVSLLLLDLDNFKMVNDTLGHHAGDRLLKVVAQRLVGALRGNDTVCRIGGDEFAVIIESKGNGAEAESVAAKLLSSLAVPVHVEKHDFYVTASIGMSVYPRDADSVEVLTRNADTAMYRAKSNGKNMLVQFAPDMDTQAQKRLAVESNLRKAIERGELELFYQPQLDLREKRVLSLEALLRWRHPEFGLVSPDDFIPLAEENGLIVPIGRWVLRTACGQAAEWRAMGLGDLRVAVNLSARQTREAGLVDEILAALKHACLPPHLLELEITETVLMDNVHENAAMLLRLQAEGIRMAIDDFGTGYSSMAYLKRFPIDQLKIDRTFVRDIPGDGDDEAIATAIIAMAHTLGMSVVAEGVETAGQQAFLHAAGCDTLQGFHFARPMPVAQVTDFLRAHNDAVYAS